ncbi:hypothetical protein GCM10027160_26630 [Streptomyces calidiresistens]|uniref:DUF4157 domain-containing protein n=1 Tax=Streptomyces calidiresistens TaxID=1485586 RepID=A0A7W3T5B4_9ACTN|nr:DUF4157 domain-containing protein [Streptomyces calidiresistens]MBB0231197.1 DUF4157 domain-containing protein [Streptomyces calidiresistens]
MRAHEERTDKAAGRQSARGAPLSSTRAERMLALQRAAGNAAVAQAIERERQEGDPGHDRDQEPAAQRALVDAAVSSPAQPLPSDLREKSERALNMDLGHVRVHTGPVAQRSAAAIGALAYTMGEHIVTTPQGMTDRVMGEEVGHVWQQAHGPVPGTDNGAGLKVSSPSDPAEKAAESFGRDMARASATSLPAPPVFAGHGGAAPGSPVQRASEQDGSAPGSPGQPGSAQDTSGRQDQDEALRNAKTPQEMVAALVASGHSQADAWELMQYMTEQQFRPAEGQQPFNMLDSIKNAGSQRLPPVRMKQAEAAGLLSKKWTIRHYTGKDPNTPPSFDEIASTYDNALAGRLGEHTNVADWRSLGNIKFTFYLVSIDGQVPHRNWLNDTHWYAEWDLDEIENCWVSPDLLETMNKSMDADEARQAMAKVKAFRGSGSALKKLLAVSVFGAGNEPAGALDTAIGGSFELKVPGGLPVKEWKRK